MRITGIAFLSALVCAPAPAAIAADCSLKLVNTIPVKVHEGLRPLVPVTINGTPKQFLLDTGGAKTQISAEAADELKLPISGGNFKMLDLYGNASNRVASVENFGLGRLIDRNTRLPIMTFRDNELFSGLLAPDYMGRFDVELDFASGKMNYFSPDHCPGKVVYWPAAAIAAVPMQFLDSHLVVDVSLDGHSFKAIVDTGATDTTLSMAEAKRVFDITPDDRNKAFEHIFKKLSFEGLEVANPHVIVIPDKVGSNDPNNGFITGTRTRRVDDRDSSDPAMLIGMNILSKLHLYIAFAENKIYITPASAPRPQ